MPVPLNWQKTFFQRYLWRVVKINVLMKLRGQRWLDRPLPLSLIVIIISIVSMHPCFFVTCHNQEINFNVLANMSFCFVVSGINHVTCDRKTMYFILIRTIYLTILHNILFSYETWDFTKHTVRLCCSFSQLQLLFILIYLKTQS